MTSRQEALDAAFLAGYNHGARTVVNAFNSGELLLGHSWRNLRSLGDVVIKRIKTHPRNKKY
mgnify:CR=1 FL=1|tara:strand:+ start:231 stop:416 length:186 start_codon:yes stop_codon:yes gene_type:complete